MVTVTDVVLYSFFAFMGNVGVALTGFGMAIVYILFWQIAVLCGYGSDFKYAVFIQAIALLCAEPLLIHKLEIMKHADKKLLLFFIPITVVSTPLGQLTSDHTSTDLIESIGGVLVTFFACFELHTNRAFFQKWFVLLLQKCHTGNSNENDEENKEEDPKLQRDVSKCESGELTRNEENMEKEQTESKTGKLAQHEDEDRTDTADSIDLDETKSNNQDDSTILLDETTHSLKKWTTRTILWTFAAGGMSGYLGGLCGISGPPIILYFLHPPSPVDFLDKNVQRATGATIILANVIVRVIHYLFEALLFDAKFYFRLGDWPLYLSVAICSMLGVMVGSQLFQYTKNSKNIIRGILNIFLLMCGSSLLLSSFASL